MYVPLLISEMYSLYSLTLVRLRAASTILKVSARSQKGDLWGCNLTLLSALRNRNKMNPYRFLKICEIYWVD